MLIRPHSKYLNWYLTLFLRSLPKRNWGSPTRGKKGIKSTCQSRHLSETQQRICRSKVKKTWETGPMPNFGRYPLIYSFFSFWSSVVLLLFVCYIVVQNNKKKCGEMLNWFLYQKVDFLHQILKFWKQKWCKKRKYGVKKFGVKNWCKKVDPVFVFWTNKLLILNLILEYFKILYILKY